MRTHSEARRDIGRDHRADTGNHADLQRLSASRLTVSAGDADIRGWFVHSREGRLLGVVDDLFVNMRELAVESMEVALITNPAHKIVLPLREATLDDDANIVRFYGTMDEHSTREHANSERMTGEHAVFTDADL